MKPPQIVTRFPCGGKLVLRCSRVVNDSLAAGERDIDIIITPEIYCAKRYKSGQGCAWLHVLWKFNKGISRRQHEGDVHADKIPVRLNETKVNNADGSMTYILNSKVGHGLVIRGSEVFQDPNFGAVFDTGPYEFDCCKNYANNFHGGIIAFLKRLFGRSKKEAK